MTREEFYQEWKNTKSIYVKTNWKSEDTKYLSSAIDGVDKVLHLVDDIPEKYICLLDLQTHSDREIAVFLSLWGDRTLRIYLPKCIREKELTFDNTIAEVRYYLNKIKALLKKRLEFLNEEITETETVFLSRIRDLKEED